MRDFFHTKAFPAGAFRETVLLKYKWRNKRKKGRKLFVDQSNLDPFSIRISERIYVLIADCFLSTQYSLSPTAANLVLNFYILVVIAKDVFVALSECRAPSFMGFDISINVIWESCSVYAAEYNWVNMLIGHSVGLKRCVSLPLAR